jgi:hypothetical protein
MDSTPTKHVTMMDSTPQELWLWWTVPHKNCDYDGQYPTRTVTVMDGTPKGTVCVMDTTPKSCDGQCPDKKGVCDGEYPTRRDCDGRYPTRTLCVMDGTPRELCVVLTVPHKSCDCGGHYPWPTRTLCDGQYPHKICVWLTVAYPTKLCVMDNTPQELWPVFIWTWIFRHEAKCLTSGVFHCENQLDHQWTSGIHLQALKCTQQELRPAHKGEHLLGKT